MNNLHPLDRPVWNALATRQAHLALGDAATILRFPPDIEPFGAALANTAEHLTALGDMISNGAVATVERGGIVPPPGFKVMIDEPIHQMAARRIGEPEPDPAILALGDSDAAEMRALAELTQPGPFYARTHILGDFVGVRENGKLIAMAGERFRVPGFTEISAVCTHPDARGRGLAAKLMRVVAAKITARGEELFLHVYPHNKAAISVYERLGFQHRADVQLTVFRRLQAGET